MISLHITPLGCKLYAFLTVLYCMKHIYAFRLGLYSFRQLGLYIQWLRFHLTNRKREKELYYSISKYLIIVYVNFRFLFAVLLQRQRFSQVITTEKQNTTRSSQSSIHINNLISI